MPQLQEDLKTSQYPHRWAGCPDNILQHIPEEVYYVVGGQGSVRVDGETRSIGVGDVVVIVPGQRHTVCQEGEGDLVLLVTCVPAYSVEEVVFTE